MLVCTLYGGKLGGKTLDTASPPSYKKRPLAGFKEGRNAMTRNNWEHKTMPRQTGQGCRRCKEEVLV